MLAPQLRVAVLLPKIYSRSYFSGIYWIVQNEKEGEDRIEEMHEKR